MRLSDHRNPVNIANIKADPFSEFKDIAFMVNELIESLIYAIKIPIMIITPPDIWRADIDSFRKIVPTIAVVKIKTLVRTVTVYPTPPPMEYALNTVKLPAKTRVAPKVK